VAAGQHQGQTALELTAAAAALREEIAVPVRPNWQADLERILTRSRSGLDEETVAAAYRRGYERSLAATIAAAAAVRIDSPVSLDLSEPAPAARYPCGLSPRELDVLRLLVAGQTDREIADSLFISPRTASKHVGAILMKLDVASRSEAAVRAVRESLV
jgi:DNA-binding NarL/FixJ family response regulator